MSPPELPRDETLQSGIALVHKSAASTVAEGQRVPEYQLAIVEYVALSVVGRRRSWRLVPGHRAPLDRQGLREFFAGSACARKRVFIFVPLGFRSEFRRVNC